MQQQRKRQKIQSDAMYANFNRMSTSQRCPTCRLYRNNKERKSKEAKEWLIETMDDRPG
jgi:hypothetical protein